MKIIFLLLMGIPLFWSCASGSFAVVDSELESDSFTGGANYAGGVKRLLILRT